MAQASEVSIFSVIRAEVEKTPHSNDESIADRLMRSLGVSTTARKSLLQLVAEEVAHQRRALTASLERSVFTSPRNLIDSDPVDVVADRACLLAETFSLGGSRGRVRWGEATIQDHEQRILFLESYRTALNETIRRHTDAIELIRINGVHCLDEVEDEVAAA